MMENKGILDGVDMKILKSGGKINVDMHQLTFILMGLSATVRSIRTMGHSQGFIETEEETEEEKQNDVLKMEEDLKLLKQAHHELVSALPELENNVKHVETLVLVLGNMRGMVDPMLFSNLSVIISDIIIEEKEKFDNITGSIDKVLKEEDAGIQSKNNEPD